MITLKATTFAAGTVLVLSEHQAGARRHLLKPLGDGRYEALLPVQFKAGEKIGFDGELPKALADSVDAGKKQRAAKAKTAVAPVEPAPASEDPARVE